MRNHKKVKALRNKFGQILGYAFWCMIIEYLTEQDGNEIEFSEIELEMFSGELGVSVIEIREMIDYCIKIELLFLNEENFIYSESLNENLEPVFDKRKRSKDISKTRKRRENGSYCNGITTDKEFLSHKPLISVVSVTETPQIEVKKSRVKKSIVDESKEMDFDLVISNFNTICIDFPKILTISKARKEKIKIRLDEITKAGITFNQLLYKMQSSDFLKGENSKKWRASFDWLIENDKNWLKVIEGNYDNREPIQKKEMSLIEYNRTQSTIAINNLLEKQQKENQNGNSTNY